MIKRHTQDLPRMKLYCAISPLRIFFERVFSPLSTSAYRPRLERRAATSDAYSFYDVIMTTNQHSLLSKPTARTKKDAGLT